LDTKGFEHASKKKQNLRTDHWCRPSKRHWSNKCFENEKEKEMFKSKKGTLAATVAIAIISSLVATPAHALGTPKTQQVVTWGWEDGADKSHRDFSEEDYDTAADMPQIQITVTPTNVGRRIILESFDDWTQTWLQSATAQTNAGGIAKLSVDPSCDETSTWCDHDTSYRIRVLKSGTQKLIVSRPFMVSYTAAVAATM